MTWQSLLFALWFDALKPWIEAMDSAKESAHRRTECKSR